MKKKLCPIIFFKIKKYIMFENKYFDDIINNLTGNNLKMKKILLNIIKKINGNEISETLIDYYKI